MGDTETMAERFREHRGLLFSVAYDMLGIVADAEDVVQDTWLKWSAASREQVVHPEAYLVRITVRESMRRLSQARARRESYVGPWLPEPLLVESDVADKVSRAESVSLALMVVLETLSPLERAVFVLREAFGYDHDEIARVLGRSPAAVRQLAHRAREHVQARRPRFAADPHTRRAVTERFLAAALGGDMDELMAVLAPDVTMWTDGGGKTRTARRPIHGADKVARLIVGIKDRFVPDLDIRFAEANGDPAAIMTASGTPYGVCVVELGPDGHRVQAIYGLANPDKLQHIAP